MIHLQIQDEFNGTTKQQDLMEVVGKTFSDNYSSTGRSRLVKYLPGNDFCVVEEVASEYKSGNQNPNVGLETREAWYVWNGFFY